MVLVRSHGLPNVSGDLGKVSDGLLKMSYGLGKVSDGFGTSLKPMNSGILLLLRKLNGSCRKNTKSTNNNI